MRTNCARSFRLQHITASKTRQTAITVTSRARQFIRILLETKELEGYSYGALLGPIPRERDAEGG